MQKIRIRGARFGFLSWNAAPGRGIYGECEGIGQRHGLRALVHSRRLRGGKPVEPGTGRNWLGLII
jgi:hypothetical protein